MAGPAKISAENITDMIALEEQLKVVILRAQHEHLEPAVAVLALCRIARTMLDMYPPNTRAALVSAVRPFLEGISDINISDIYLT